MSKDTRNDNGRRGDNDIKVRFRMTAEFRDKDSLYKAIDHLGRIGIKAWECYGNGCPKMESYDRDWSRKIEAAASHIAPLTIKGVMTRYIF